jgi:hypothetical protein
MQSFRPSGKKTTIDLAAAQHLYHGARAVTQILMTGNQHYQSYRPTWKSVDKVLFEKTSTSYIDILLKTKFPTRQRTASRNGKR